MVMNMPSSYLAQRFGRRAVLVGGPTLRTVGAILMTTSHSYGELVFYQFIVGLGAGMYTTGVFVYLTDISTPANRARYLSLQQGSLLFGVSIGPVIGGFTAEQWGLRAPFYLLAGLSALSALWAFTQIPEIRVTQPRPVPSPDLTRSREKGGIGSLLLNPSFLVVCLLTLAIFLNRAGGRQSIIPLYGADKGLSPSQLGLLFTAIVTTQFFTLLALGSLSDRFGRKVTILPSVLISLLGLVLFILTNSYWALILSGLFIGFGEGLIGPSPAAFAGDLAPPGRVALAMGLYRTFGDVGFILGPVLMGWIADISDFRWALGVDGLFLLSVALTVIVVARETAGRRVRSVSRV
jgi:MFS family permease